MIKKGTLYLVPTPIGNLSDMTYRAVEILKKVSLIAAEDTRISAKLLSHFEIHTKLISYHKFNERSRVNLILDVLFNGKDVAVISDAGTPTISDPAEIIVKEAIGHGLEVCCLPGATAIIPALAASGLDTKSFVFVGFLPDKPKHRQARITDLSKYPETIIIYESGNRVIKTLQELLTVFGNRKVCLAREISKMHETYLRSDLQNLTQIVDMETRGEFVIVIEGTKEKTLSDEELNKEIKTLLQDGYKTHEISEILAKKTGTNKNYLYKLTLQVKHTISDL